MITQEITNYQETQPSDEKRQALEVHLQKQIASGLPEEASKTKSELLGLKHLDLGVHGIAEGNPAPHGITISSANYLVDVNPVSPLAINSPRHKAFLRGRAEAMARVADPLTGERYIRVKAGTSALSNMIDSPDNSNVSRPKQSQDELDDATGIAQAKLATDLTGRYRLGSDGSFTAIGEGDTFWAAGSKRVDADLVTGVRTYLDTSGYTEIGPDEPSLLAIMPDVNLQKHNLSH